MLYIIGFGISFFLSIILFSKKNKSLPDKLLAIWLCIIGIHLVLYYLFVTVDKLDNKLIISFGLALPLLHGGFLYLYTLFSTSRRSWTYNKVWYFSPFLIVFAFYTCFFLFSWNETISEKNRALLELGKSLLIFASGIVYTFLSFRQLLKYRRSMVQQFSNTEKINFNWLLYLILWIGIIWLLVIFVRMDEFVFGSVALFVIWLGYFGIKQVQLFSQFPTQVIAVSQLQTPAIISDPKVTTSLPEEPLKKVKYQHSYLSEEQGTLIHSALNKLMVEKLVFQNPDLTLDELAAQLLVHPNTLSQVINSIEQKNFYDYINGMRIAHFISLISKTENQKYTILHLAFECGFNSKAAFNRNFKKVTNLTPSEYIQLQKNKLSSSGH